jgi:hypothetical protein
MTSPFIRQLVDIIPVLLSLPMIGANIKTLNLHVDVFFPHSLQTQNLMKLREGAASSVSDKPATTTTDADSSSSSSTTSTPTASTAAGGGGGGGSRSIKGKKTVAQRLRNAPPEQVDNYSYDPDS